MALGLTGICQMIALHSTSANFLSTQQYVLAYGFADRISSVKLSSTYLTLFFFQIFYLSHYISPLT